MSRRKKRGRGKGRIRPKRRHEWIGGRLSPPIFFHDREEPYRPELVIWLAASSGLVVGQDAVAPEDAEGAVARALLAALDRPLAGPKHRPDVIRVADHALAAEVRAAVADTIPVIVAPTPELDTVVKGLIEWMPDTDEGDSYFEGGRIPPEVVAELFTAAAHLYRTAPWKVVADTQVIGMDIPALGVEGACVSILGHLGANLGVLICPSLAGYEAFGRTAAGGALEGDGPVDLGTHSLSLNFVRGADLPGSMRREAATHAWPVAGPDAYPLVMGVERDGVFRPLVPRDLKIATACAATLCCFFEAHRNRFALDTSEPVCGSYSFDPHDVEVRFTFPYEEARPYEEAPPLESGGERVRRPAPPTASAPQTPPERPMWQGRTKPGRNDPCPCGSGRKYKKCCLPRDKRASGDRGRGRGRPGVPPGGIAGAPGQTADAPETALSHTHPSEPPHMALHELDISLTYEIMEFAAARFGSAWHDYEKDFTDADAVPELSAHWAVYHYRVDGTTALDRYLEEYGQRLPPARSAWLEAEAAAWVSVWEVIEVEPGRSMTLRDLLSHEERHVQETTASEQLVTRDAVLVRVVDYDGISILGGLHRRPLPSRYAAEVVRRMRGGWLRRKRAMPLDRLRDEAFGRRLIRRWEAAVAKLDERSGLLPDLSNTDGDPLLFTTDHFRIAPGAKPMVEARLATLEDVNPPIPEDPAYVFLRPGGTRHGNMGDTVLGRAVVSGETLRIETNSRERADALRKRVETACGDRIRHRGREHADPLPDKAALALPDSAPESLSPVPAQLALELKQHHYADWPDQPLPALKGRTPRETVRTAEGRAAVDDLLKDMENEEQRSPPGAAFDFSEVRRTLGLG